MNWIKRFFVRERVYEQFDEYSSLNDKSIEIGEENLDFENIFDKHKRFERVWVDNHINNLSRESSLTDNDYIDYHIWEDKNCSQMYEKYLPNSLVIRGVNPNLIFHGSCLGCISQRNHGVNRCKGCQYFRGNWSNPDLHIEGEEAATINRDDLKRLLGGE